MNRKSEDGSCLFGGWARMAQPIAEFTVVEVIITCVFILAETNSRGSNFP